MQGENERQWRKENGNTYDISSIKRVTEKFLKFHDVGVQNNGEEMYKKSVLNNYCAARAKLLLLIRPSVVFHRFPALHAFAA